VVLVERSSFKMMVVHLGRVAVADLGLKGAETGPTRHLRRESGPDHEGRAEVGGSFPLTLAPETKLKNGWTNHVSISR
jgi:hypothetical protein